MNKIVRFVFGLYVIFLTVYAVYNLIKLAL